jgi:hypothetical protein
MADGGPDERAREAFVISVAMHLVVRAHVPKEEDDLVMVGACGDGVAG